MAKKQQQGKKQPRPKELINTNVFVKGMVKDTDSSYFDKQSWYHARNLINNSIDGDLGVVGNEPANLRCAKIPYTIIGGIHLYGDTWVIYSTNDTLSEIGLFDDSKCEYTTIVNDQCLNFNQDNLIIGAAKENFDCSWQVYWDDGLNPSRTLNLDNVPYEQIIDPDTPAGSTCIEYINATPLRLDCEQIRLAPLVDNPCVVLEKADQGGFLENGSYQVYIAYVIHDKPVTDYIGISNIQSIWSHEDTQGSLLIKLSNLDKDFEFISVVIRSRVKGQPVNTELGIYSTQTEVINVDSISAELPKILSSTLQRRNPAYEKSDGMFVVNDYLIRSQPTEQFDFNYQPLANQISTYWTSTQYPSNYYKNGGNKPTLLRDEQYSFFIRFIYNTGERSKSYHIPGRAPNANETALIGSPNSIDPNDTVFKAINTATTTPGDPFIASMIGTQSDDGGLIVDGGQMGYWESTEVYNPTDSVRWANLCGLPIRHHKIPDETVGGAGTPVSTNSGNFINVIGVAFNNIAAPLYNDGTVIPNIVGYEILVGSRAGNRSILAKGIMKNMFRFQRNQNDDNINPLGTGLLPNYPYNDLRGDPYLINRDTGANNLPWYSQINGAFGAQSIESNWHRGNRSQADGSGFQPTQVDNRTYTFHSPELNFSKLYLNPSEIKAYKVLGGEVNGRFKKSEDHPQHKLLKNRSATVAALIGVGYALAEMRGKRDYKIDTMQSNSIGEFGAYGLGSGTHMSPFIGPGTAQAAGNVGATSASIWAGVAADLVFNSAVDIAAIFGGGKLARQIGTPIYQQVETGMAALAAGHIGPKRSIQYNGTDFTSVPTIMSVAIGLISFLNYVAVGGDKVIDLILNLIGFQDYAVKYISHGFYNQENQFAGPQWRIGVDKARYIKSALQSFDGVDQIQNNLRPSTVVVRTTENWSTSWPSNNGLVDNTKFTIGAGPCAGDRNHSMNWYDPGEEVRSTAYANYVALKTPMDNQYGQLEGIIQLNTQGCYSFIDQQNVDVFGNPIPITPLIRFSTDTVYAGDCYIGRYTEKTIMPFFYTFLKGGKDGIPFDYSKYANVPFPRFWMNTEKYRMDEFVRPITSLTFNWSNSSEALPSGYYNLDAPENGGYCGPDSLPAMFGEGGLAGTTTQDGSTTGAGSATTAPTGTVSAFGGNMWTELNDPWNVDNGYAAFNNRFRVIQIDSSNGGNDIPYTIKMTGSSQKWEIIGAGQDEITITPAAGVSALVQPFQTTPNFNIKLNSHGYATPLNINNAGPNINHGGGGCPAGDFKDFVREDMDDDTSVPNMFTSTGNLSVRAIFDFSTNNFIGITNVGTGFYASNSLLITTADPNDPTVGTGDLSDLITSQDSFSFSSDGLSTSISDSDPWCSNNAQLPSGSFWANGTDGTRYISSSFEDVVFAGGPGDLDGLIDDLEQSAGDSAFNDNQAVNGEAATGGLFVVKTGYMYTHNCGINDFFVESSINLAYRDWEEVDRKRHYDHDEYTDLVELFHAKIINFDNYYFADRSTAVDKFWGSSWGQIQERWYDPNVSETCFIKYPKRLLYSAPATGWIDKASMGNKNDAKQDFWRVYLSENFRDFKDKVTTIKPINQTGALIMFPTLSPKLFQGQDRLKLSNTKITIGDGGLFSQAFQNITNSDLSHEYGSCESARSVLNTPSGIYFVSQAQGKIFQYAPGSALTAISDQGMKWWFNKFLPSKLLESFPLIEDCPQAVDNPVNGAGVQTVYDTFNDIIYFSKKDYLPIDQNPNIKEMCLEYIPCEGFVYNATICEGLPQLSTCPDGYTLIQDPITGQDTCQLLYTTPPTVNQTLELTYGVAVGDGTDTGLGAIGSTRYGRDWPIVIDFVAADGMPANQGAPSTWHYITDNGFNSWWRNSAATITGGIVNRLMRGINNAPAGQFAQAEFQINIPVAKTVHLLLAADNRFTIDIDSGGGYANLLTPVDATLYGSVTGGIWSGQTGPGQNFTWLNGDVANASQYSKAWIYRLELPSGCTKFRMTGTNDNLSPAGLAAAVIDVDDYQVIQDVTSWEQLPKIWDSETYDFVLPGSVKGFTCEDGYQQFTDGTDGGTEECPVCRKDSIIYNCECQIDPTSNLPGVLFGVCPVGGEGSIGSSYCQYEAYEDVTLIDQTYPIELDNPQYFKDISWTISYDPKAKAWLSFHDWHPELSFNSIKHFLTSKTEMTTVPQCPPGYTWDGTECCQAFHYEELAEVNVEEFISTETITDATVEAFSETMDFAIVIDFSTSMLGAEIDAAMLFTSTFVTGMAPGMDNGPYAGQVRIGHGRWGSGTSTNAPGDPAVIVPLTSDPAIAGGSLDDNNSAEYLPDSGTNFNDGIDLANTMLAGSTAQQKIVIFVSDAGAAPGNPTNLTNATQLIALKVDGASNADACDLSSGYAANYSTLVTDTGLPSSPAYDVPRCAANGTLIRNMYHIGGNIPFGQEGHPTQVANDLVASFTTCTCTQGVMDTWVGNPPCLPLPNPPPQCLECSCPDGYTMVGECNDSSNLPVCRKMDCECTRPYFNEDEVFSQTGFCDDIYLWYNPASGVGDPTYVNSDPLFCVYDYQDCVPANYEIGYFWKHNYRTDLFNNYYDVNYPWEVDIIEQTGQQVTTLRSIEYQMEAYLYQNEGKDRFHDLDYNFDEAVIYNSEQVSGLLRLVLEPKNNIQLSMMYPIVGANDIQTLFSKVEQKYRFNQFWDITFDRGEFSNTTNTIWETDWDGYTRVLNPANLNYAKAQHQRKKFRHYFNHVLLRKSDEMATTRKMLLKLENTKLNQSFR